MIYKHKKSSFFLYLKNENNQKKSIDVYTHTTIKIVFESTVLVFFKNQRVIRY